MHPSERGLPVTTLTADLIGVIFNAAVTICVGVMVAKLTGMVSRSESRRTDDLAASFEREQAMEAGMLAILRRELVDSYRRYVVEKHPMSVERSEEITACYEAYHRLGGNGTGEKMYQAICKVNPMVDGVTDYGDDI